MERVAINTGNLNSLEASQKFKEEMKPHTQVQAEAALSHSFSECQIANVELVGNHWQAEIKPGLICCGSPATEK